MIDTILNYTAFPQEEYIFGTADLTGLIDKKFGEFCFGISIGKKLEDGIIQAISNGPTIEYYNHYFNTNKELSKIAENLKTELLEIGIESIIISPTITLDISEFDKYLQNLTADISHKMVATRAGLGWIGKTDLFISEKFGPRLRLVSLLINKKPEIASVPINESKCGKCKTCIDKCPAQAANGKLWNTTIHRDEFFNAQKCREKCVEFGPQKLKIEKPVCGICVSVCPIGKL